MLEAKLAFAPPNGVVVYWKSALQGAAQALLGHMRRHREEWLSDGTWVLVSE